MNAEDIIRKAQEDYSRVSKTKVDGVTGLSKTDDGWVVLLEALERRAIPDTMDVLGVYEVRVDNEGNLLGFQRKKLRKRGETEER
jgi:hypothetical protein